MKLILNLLMMVENETEYFMDDCRQQMTDICTVYCLLSEGSVSVTHPSCLSLHRVKFIWIFPPAWRHESLTRMAPAEGMTLWWPGAPSPASSSRIDSSAGRAPRLCTFLQGRRWVCSYIWANTNTKVSQNITEMASYLPTHPRAELNSQSWWFTSLLQHQITHLIPI